MGIFSGKSRSAPDLSFLSNLDKFRFLLDEDIELSPEQRKAGFARSEDLFSDLIGSIGSLEGVDTLRGELDSDLLNTLLEDIQRDTEEAFASEKLDQFDRGLIGAGGVSSDISERALSDVRNKGLRTKAAARTEFAGRELDRLREREKFKRDAINSAFTRRFDVGSQSDANLLSQLLGIDATRELTFADIANERDLTLANALASIFANESEEPDFLKRVVQNFGTSFGESFGKNLGASSAKATSSGFKTLLGG